jgi:hypothetical protein
MLPPEGYSSQAEIAAVWRTRLDKAKAEYDLAAAEFRRSAKEHRFGESPAADSDFALRHAIAAENQARQKYVHILKVFTELIVSGKVPPED